MQITDRQQQIAATLLAGTVDEQKKKKRKTSSLKNAGNDSVEFSPEMQDIFSMAQQVFEAVVESPLASKLREIKLWVKKGQYRINCEQLANDMISM